MTDRPGKRLSTTTTKVIEVHVQQSVARQENISVFYFTESDEISPKLADDFISDNETYLFVASDADTAFSD